MKKMVFLGLLAGLLAWAACDKNDDDVKAPACGEGCLFTVQNKPGTVVFLSCFSRYGIQTTHPDTDSLMYAVPDEIPGNFQAENKKVVFSGSFRQNTLTPGFPDPSIGTASIYQMTLTKIE